MTDVAVLPYPEVAHELTPEQKAARDRFSEWATSRHEVVNAVLRVLDSRLGEVRVLELVNEVLQANPDIPRSSIVVAIYEDLQGSAIEISADGLVVAPSDLRRR